MAQYEAQCSKVGSFAYSQYFKLYVDMWQDSLQGDVDIANNKSRVRYNVYCLSSGSGSIEATHWKYFNFNGQEICNVTEKINVSSPNAYIHIASGTTDWIEHNNDGSKSIWFSAQIKGNTYGVSASLEGTFELVKIPRYTTVWNSERGKTINTISIAWSTADARDWTQYSLNDGGWQDAYDSVAGDNRSGYYTIHNLQPNTTYKVRTRCRRTDSGLWSEAGYIWITTYDYSKINSIPEFNFGDNETIGYSNPSGNSMKISIYNTEGSIAYCGYRQCEGTSYTFDFTQKELDRLYKLFKNNTITVRVYLVTTCNGVDYYDYYNVTIRLTGNQKTIRTNVNNEWKRGKLWTCVNGTWKRGVSWQNVNGTWKRGG